MTRLTAALLAGVLMPVMTLGAQAGMGPYAAPRSGNAFILVQDAECGPGTGVKCQRNDGGGAAGEAKPKRENQKKKRQDGQSSAEESLKKRQDGERKRGQGEEKAKRNEGGGSDQSGGERKRGAGEEKAQRNENRGGQGDSDQASERRRNNEEARKREAEEARKREAEQTRKREAEQTRKRESEETKRRDAERKAEETRRRQEGNEGGIAPRRESLGKQLERDGVRRNDSAGGDASGAKPDDKRRERVERLRKQRLEKAERVRRERDADRERERKETLRDVREQRRERREADGRVIIEEGRGRRIVTNRDGDVIIYNDERDRLRYSSRDVTVRQLPDGFEETTVWRRNGVRVVTVRDRWGNVVERSRVFEDGRRYVLFENDPYLYERPDDLIVRLPLPPILIPRERYIVEAESAPPQVIYETFAAPPVAPVERRYGLEQVVNSPDLLGRVRRVDVDSVTFASGSWQVDESQIGALDTIADSLLQLIDDNPGEVFLVEGHTDAIGSDLDNLSLSDRRAEEVAYLLTEYYDVPAENLTTKGYGERYLKVPTSGPARENRRVTMRRITPLLETAAN
jgi:outer membrane protein OmpA-like peptidoglycan-associated protein